MRPRVQMAWCLWVYRDEGKTTPLCRTAPGARLPLWVPRTRRWSPETCASCRAAWGLLVGGRRQGPAAGGPSAHWGAGAQTASKRLFPQTTSLEAAQISQGSVRVTPPFKHQLSIKCLFWRPKHLKSALPVPWDSGSRGGAGTCTRCPQFLTTHRNAPDSATEAGDKDIGCL